MTNCFKIWSVKISSSKCQLIYKKRPQATTFFGFGFLISQPHGSLPDGGAGILLKSYDVTKMINSMFSFYAENTKIMLSNKKKKKSKIITKESNMRVQTMCTNEGEGLLKFDHIT